jgi:putative endonuclease
LHSGRSAVRTRYSPQLKYVVYIIFSESIDRYYIGQTNNLENRLYRHLNSGSKSTKKAKDWLLVYKEIYLDRSTAIKRELEIKSKKSTTFIKQLINKV